MNTNLRTEADVAERDLKIDAERMAELRRQHKWPHVRLGRFDVRYTDEQVQQIVEMQTVKPSEVAAAAAAGPKISGQTSRSAARKKAS